MTQSTTQKHLGMLMEVKLEFYLNNIYSKVNKARGLLRKLHNTLPPRLPLLKIYKSFIRPHLDYDDIISDKTHIASIHQNIESI